MRKTIGSLTKISLSLIIMVTISCHNWTDVSDLLEPPTGISVLTAVKNNQLWSAAALAEKNKDSTYFISCKTIGKDSFYKETLVFTYITLKGSRSHKIVPSVLRSKRKLTENEVGCLYATLDHDAIIEPFDLDTTVKSNYFKITDEDAFHIEVEFDATVVGIVSKRVFRFKKGRFYANIMK